METDLTLSGFIRIQIDERFESIIELIEIHSDRVTGRGSLEVFFFFFLEVR